MKRSSLGSIFGHWPEQALRRRRLHLEELDRLPDRGAFHVSLRRHGVARIAGMVVIDAQHRNMPAHRALDERRRVSRRQYRSRRPPATDELDGAACASSPRARSRA
jgi:hypothetical protein